MVVRDQVYIMITQIVWEVGVGLIVIYRDALKNAKQHRILQYIFYVTSSIHLKECMDNIQPQTLMMLSYSHPA